MINFRMSITAFHACIPQCRDLHAYREFVFSSRVKGQHLLHYCITAHTETGTRNGTTGELTEWGSTNPAVGSNPRFPPSSLFGMRVEERLTFEKKVARRKCPHDYSESNCPVENSETYSKGNGERVCRWTRAGKPQKESPSTVTEATRTNNRSQNDANLS